MGKENASDATQGRHRTDALVFLEILPMSQPRNRLSGVFCDSVEPAPPPVPGLSPTGFVMYPMPAVTPAQAELYQKALEQAQAVNQPPVDERDGLGYWN